MRLIGQASVDRAFKSGEVRRVMVVRQTDGGWYLMFEAGDPLGQFAMKTQRDGLRVWRDPRSLFQFLEDRYGIRCGGFLLEKGNDKDG